LLFSIFFILSFAIYSVSLLCLYLIQPIGCHTNKVIIIICAMHIPAESVLQCKRQFALQKRTQLIIPYFIIATPNASPRPLRSPSLPSRRHWPGVKPAMQHNEMTHCVCAEMGREFGGQSPAVGKSVFGQARNDH